MNRDIEKQRERDRGRGGENQQCENETKLTSVSWNIRVNYSKWVSLVFELWLLNFEYSNYRAIFMDTEGATHTIGGGDGGNVIDNFRC